MAKTLLACLIMWLAMVATAISARQLPSKHDKGKFRTFDEDSLASIVYDSTVSKKDRGAYPTITEALAAALTNSKTKYYIHVKADVYRERVEVSENLTNIVLVGDGASSTIVQLNRQADEYKTSETGTIAINGDGFVAMFISFENTAGDIGQAAASVTTANHAAFYKCAFRGFEDTLYAKSGIQFYRECDIYGTVDFIFGAAAAVFQSCNIYADKPRTITFTAQSKESPTPQPSGFVIQNCTLTVAPGLEPLKPKFTETFLGRPWSNYSIVVVMESYLDSIIQPAGWLEWPERTTDKLVYREFNNRGPGAPTARRVNWLDYKDVSGHPEEVRSFTVGKFINKVDWLTSTNIPYSNGFINA